LAKFSESSPDDWSNLHFSLLRYTLILAWIIATTAKKDF
jgi:hypothetical protein